MSSFDHYIIPEILHWEDRATEWSGKPDKIEIKVTIHEGQDSKELTSAIISGKSKWATFGGYLKTFFLSRSTNILSLSSEEVLTINSNRI